MASFPILLPRYEGPETSETYNNLYEQSVVQWTNAAFEEAEYDQAGSDELNLVGGYIDYLYGKQWTNARPQNKSRPVNNKMIRLFWELVGQLTDIRPVIEIHTTQFNPGPAVKRSADVLNKGMKAWSLANDFDLTLAMCIAYAVLTTSFAKFVWNPHANMGEGDLQMIPLPPDAVMPLKARNTLESSEVIIFKDIWSLRQFRQAYPTTGSTVAPDEKFSNFQISPTPPANIPPMVYRFMSEGVKRQIAGATRMAASAVPMNQYREFWVKDETRNESSREVVMGKPGTNWCYKVHPGGKLYPRGRLIAMGGKRVILYDGPNPYWHGQAPFAMLRLNIVPWSFYGLSDLRSQTPLQDIINNILAGVLDAIKRAVNPAFFAPKNAFSEQLWQSLDFSLPGARAGYSAQTAHEPKFVPPPVLPGYVLAVMQAVEREMDQTSVGSIASEAARKKQIPAAEGLEQLKAEKQTPVRLKGRNIESFLRVGGQMMVSNMVQFWSAQRRMQILGSEGLTFEDFDWDPGTMVPQGEPAEEFVKKFKFYIQPGSLLSIKRIEEKMEVFALAKMHLIDIRTIYKKLGGDYNVDEIIRGLKEQAQLLPQPAPKGGKKATA